MSNRIDFFQSEQTQLAVPAATASILLEGQLCPYLELIEIVRGGWPEFGRARLAYNPAAYQAMEIRVQLFNDRAGADGEYKAVSEQVIVKLGGYASSSLGYVTCTLNWEDWP